MDSNNTFDATQHRVLDLYVQYEITGTMRLFFYSSLNHMQRKDIPEDYATLQ